MAIRRIFTTRRGRLICVLGLLGAAGGYALSGTDACQAKAQEPAVYPVVGETPSPDQIRLIDNPGRVGLGPGHPGSRFAIVAGHLVRIDAVTGRIQSILRPLPHLPD
ncbi:hypothetical protein E4191_11365 [Paracoccus liaowanqingii]|uniref:Nickel/cobalt transporter regulator n=1 Tax=Paracoccus liaowanqingii TaxID=2560053 RepID=A0A4P7HPA6_9RHOB|nr:hypothetical protein [Paracoccus liaowanqingii]QBX35227.1 hypothetical protein E4191_11365 [Paracoccus liaowanqingii]